MHISGLTPLRWAAWQPGHQRLEDWRAALNGEIISGTDTAPDVSFVEPMLRRRLSRLSRMLLAVAKRCRPNGVGKTAYIFANRHGELGTTVQLLQTLARQETPSPMGFSLSVHNTAAGLYSIALGDHSPATAIAAGKTTLSAALTEAAALLLSGEAEQVVLAYAEEPVPEPLRACVAEQESLRAIGLLLVHSQNTETLLPDSASALMAHCIELGVPYADA